MSIEKTPSGWSVDFYIDGRKGKRVRKDGFKTKTIAKNYINETLHLYDNKNISLTGDKRTFMHLYEIWYKQRGMFKTVIKKDKKIIEVFSKLIGNPLAKDLNSNHVYHFRTYLKEAKNLENSTINH